jgi:hypothetical protein
VPTKHGASAWKRPRDFWCRKIRHSGDTAVSFPSVAPVIKCGAGSPHADSVARKKDVDNIMQRALLFSQNIKSQTLCCGFRLPFSPKGQDRAYMPLAAYKSLLP